jgi:hypothetical protein
LDLLTTYTCTRDSELQAITAPALISTIHISPQHPLSHFPTCCVFTSRSLATASNSGDSSASRAQLLSSQLNYQLATDHIVEYMSVAAETCLPSLCPETTAARTTENTLLPLLRPLPSNGCCLQSCLLATGLYATLCSNSLSARLQPYKLSTCTNVPFIFILGSNPLNTGTSCTPLSP